MDLCSDTSLTHSDYSAEICSDTSPTHSDYRFLHVATLRSPSDDRFLHPAATSAMHPQRLSLILLWGCHLSLPSLIADVAMPLFLFFFLFSPTSEAACPSLIMASTRASCHRRNPASMQLPGEGLLTAPSVLNCLSCLIVFVKPIPWEISFLIREHVALSRKRDKSTNRKLMSSVGWESYMKDKETIKAQKEHKRERERAKVPARYPRHSSCTFAQLLAICLCNMHPSTPTPTFPQSLT
jgi:hypothetical protein